MVTFIEKAQIEEVVGTKIKNLGLYQKLLRISPLLRSMKILLSLLKLLNLLVIPC